MYQALRPGSLKEFTTELFNNASQSDVYFEFTDGVRYCGHKLLLSRSSVFDRMFNVKDWKETINLVKIDDIPSEDFYEFLRFLYTDEVNLTEKNFIGVGYAAHKYNIKLLETICADFLCGVLNLNNVIQYLEQSYKCEIIGEEVLCFVDDNIKTLIENKSLFTISQEPLMEILCRDSLRCNEFELFKFTLEWSQHAIRSCEDDAAIKNKKTKYSAVFNLIRFPTMNADEFLKCFSLVPDFFTAVETHAILRYCTKKEDDNLIYSTVARRWGYKFLTFEKKGVLDKESNVKTVEFAVNKIIQIQSFFVGTQHKPSGKKFILKLFKDCHQAPIFSADVCTSAKRINCRKKLTLHPETTYTMYTESDSSLEYSACKGALKKEFIFSVQDFETHIYYITYKRT